MISVPIFGDLDNKFNHTKVGCDIRLKTPNILMKTSGEFGKCNTFCPEIATQLQVLCGK